MTTTNDPRYPNGQCSACGWGADDEGACQNDTCGNYQFVVVAGSDINPIENGVQRAYIEIREAIGLLLNFLPQDERSYAFTESQVQEILVSLDDAVSNNWDELMAAFWRGVKQDIELMEEA